MSMPTQFWSLVVIGVELLGIASAVHALMHVRSDRGTIAWCVALVAMPFIALPLYAIFGRSHFARYSETISEAFDDLRTQAAPLAASVRPFELAFDDDPHSAEAVLAKLSPFSFTRNNHLELLVDGGATFDAIFDSIKAAKDYIFIEFYIIRDDLLGEQLRDLLVERATAGTRVYVLYDEIGSKDLSSSYLDSLHDAGVETASFGPPLRRCDFFHLNFRNHRKIVVIDGETAFVGGHNVGKEYLGKDPTIGAWRDTHVKMTGPAAMDCQRIFLESWYWATRERPPLRDTCALPQASPNHEALVLPTGPVRGSSICTLAYKALISSAKERCWIASPYFVPNDSILDELRYAALRGVDVRILLPEKADHLIVYLASYAYFNMLKEWNIKFYRYEKGFLHQKVILIDDSLAGVTTINLDQRSFHLNFEIGLFSMASEFVSKVATVLEKDFSESRLARSSDYSKRSLPFRIAVNCARLFSPVL